MGVCYLSTYVACAGKGLGGCLFLSVGIHGFIMKSYFITHPQVMEAFVCLTEPFSRLRGNIKSPKAEGHNHEAVASGLILPLCNFHPHQSCICFMVIFTGSWLLSYHSGTPAAVAYNTIWPSCHIPAMGVWASGGVLIHTVTKEDPPPITLITSTPK